MTTETAAKTQTLTSQRLLNKIAIITGSAQGIGLATAELMAREGAKIVLVDIDQALVEASAKKMVDAGFEAIGLKADVTKLDEAVAAIKATVEKFGKIDILVNNAGITRDNLLMRMSEADWDLVLDINLKGAFNFTKAVSRSMLKARSGWIVNIASVVGQEGNAGQANYAASKGGLIAFSKSIAREFSSRGIMVNTIAPGFIHTRLTDAVPIEYREALLKKILLGRMGEPIEIARVVVFLCSEDASYITGQCLGVNGGGYIY